MRHRKIGRKFNKNSSHRKAMILNLARSLILHGIIKTTLPKAKELRRVIEPIITISKIKNIFNKRFVFSKIRNNNIVFKLFNELGPLFLNRSGGYTRILKCGFRFGDNAPMAFIEFVDKDKIKYFSKNESNSNLEHKNI